MYIKSLVSICLISFAGGCVMSAADRCTSFGFQTGTDDYAQCLAEEDRLKRENRAALARQNWSNSDYCQFSPYC